MSVVFAKIPDIASAGAKPSRVVYDGMRDSGILWFGDIPEHWIVDRLKWTTHGCKNGIWGNELDGENDIACVRVADFDRTKFRVHIDQPTLRAVEPRDRRGRLLAKGDLLLEKSGGGENQPVGAVVLYEHTMPAVCSNFVARMPVAEGCDSHFLAYLHSHLYAKRINTRSIKQTTGIQNLDSQAYLDERVAYPAELPEQQAIARFLDRETAKIDALVAKKERLIELLKEKRTALISHAVTKGLDPNAPMKDSGVEWLGEVPEHWQTMRLKHVSPKQTVGCVINPSSYFEHEGVPFLLGNNVEEGYLRLDKVRFVSHENNKGALRKSMMRAGDLVVVRVGDPGVTAVIPEELDCCNVASMMIVRQSQSFFSKWLQHAFNSRPLRAQVDVVKYGAAQKQFNISHAIDFWFAVPPKDEQEEIAREIDNRLVGLDELTARITEAIERLREYRTALISAAVTGKIDVRGEVDEPVATIPMPQPPRQANQPRQPNKYFCRTVLAAEIIEQLRGTAGFGRVKLQKAIILAERHLRLDEIDSRPKRQAAGPFDNAMMRSVHRQLEEQKWEKPTRLQPQGWRYDPLENQGGHKKYFTGWWEDRRQPFSDLMALLAKMDMQQAEIVATLYMAWNDFLIAGEEVTDDRLVNEVLTNWHSSKREIGEDRWRNAIPWMRDKGLVPTGYGSATRMGASR